MIFLRIAVFFAALSMVGGAQGQIAFRAASSNSSAVGASPTFVATNSTTVNAASATVSRPGGINQSDVLVAQITVKGVRTITPPAGWTLVDATSTSTALNEMTQGVYWRRVTNIGTEPASYTWTFSAGDRAVVSVTAYRNVNPVGSPIDVFGVNSENNATFMTLPTITTTQNNTLLVALLGSSRASNTHGIPTGMTIEEYEFSSGAGPNGVTSSLDEQALPSAGSSGAKTATMGTQNDYVAHLIALAGGSALSIAVPSATVIGDVMIASIGARPCSSTNNGACTLTIGTPAGWNLITTINQGTGGAFGNRVAVYWRVATAADIGAVYTWSFAGTPVHTGAVGGIASFSGVDTTSPIVVNAGQATASSLTHATPSVTPSVANTMLVTTHTINASGSWAPPTGMTEAVDIASLPLNDNNGITVEMNYQPWTNAVATGTRTATLSGPNPNTGATHILALRPGLALAHYAISVASGTVANCDYAQVTITGHDANHNPVVPPAGRSLSLTTSTTSGVWQAGTVAGTGAWTPSGSNNGAATYVWPGGAEQSFTVRLRQSAVTSLTVSVNDGTFVQDAGENPTISFVNSALRISNGANASAAIGTQIAGKPSNTGFGAQTLFLQAVRTDTNTGACTSLFPSGTDVSITVGAQCNNPASCTQNLTLSSSAASSSTATFVPTGAFATSMNFRFTTANAEAPFTVNYADAGQITLQFRAALPSPPANQFVTGTSNAFVVRPFGIAFRGANSATAIAHSSSPTVPAAPFAAAGDNFTMTLTAYQWVNGQDANNDGVPDSTANIAGNATTPNFAGTATVSATSNLAGVTGTVSRGATCATTPATVTLAAGTATANDWCYSEAGNVLLSATVSNYLGSGQDVTGSSGFDGDTTNGPYVGRFHPKKFVVSNVALTTRSDLACAPASSFTYMDETLRLGLRLTAQNAQGATTQNYTGSYALLGVGTFASWNLGARDAATATDVSSRIDSGVAPTGSWSNGVANMTFTTAIKRTLPPGNLDNPAGPFSTLHFGIAPTDSDGTAMDTLDLDVDGVGGNDHRDLGFVTDVRFGRLRLDNALGSEARRLAVPMSVEYWSGSGFATNTADNCTSIPRSAIALDFTPVSNLTACETAVDSATLTFASGVAPLGLVKPGTGNNGSVALTVNLGTAAGTYCPAVGAGTAAATSVAMPYLLGRWNDAVDADANPNTAYDDKPGARGSFGLYGSQPGTFIYFRERFD